MVTESWRGEKSTGRPNQDEQVVKEEKVSLATWAKKLEGGG